MNNSRSLSRFARALRLASAFGTVVMMGSLGCTGSDHVSASPPINQFVYVTNELDNSITEYRTNDDGSLQIIGQVSTGRRPGAILTTAGIGIGKVFVANRDDNTISQYLIQDASQPGSVPGTLIPSVVPTVPTGKNPSGMSLQTGGDMLIYVTCEGDNSVIVYKVYEENPTSGPLQQVAMTHTGNGPIDVSGTNVLNGAGNTVSQFMPAINTGSDPLVPGTPATVATLTAPSRICTDYSYLVNTPFFVISRTANAIQPFNTPFELDSLNSLPTEPGKTLPTGRAPSAVILANGSNVYVANFGDNTISYYRTSSSLNTGDVTQLVHLNEFVTGAGPYDLAEGKLRRNRDFIYCINRTDATVETFYVNNDLADTNGYGSLTALSSARTGNGPARVAIFAGYAEYKAGAYTGPTGTGNVTVPIR